MLRSHEFMTINGRMSNRRWRAGSSQLPAPAPLHGGLRVIGTATGAKDTTVGSGSTSDSATVQSYARDIRQACIDLIDLPHDHDAQQRVIQLLQYKAPAAEQAMTRLGLAQSS